jgi:hypothetical protein
MPDSPRLTGDAFWLDVVHGGARDREAVRGGRCQRSAANGTMRRAARSLAAGSPEGRGVGRLGDYQCRVMDERGELLFAWPYNSLFAEWVTTAEAESGARDFVEPLLLPEATSPVTVCIDRRSARGHFEPLGELHVAPGDLEPAGALPEREVRLLSSAAPADSRVNLLFMAEGYAGGEADKFYDASRALTDMLFAVEPYRSSARLFDVRAAFAPSGDSGISDPGGAGARKTIVGASYGAFGLDRYMLPFDDGGIRRVVDGVPCDTLVIVCNSEKYGGGGVFNRYAVVAAHNPNARYLMVHEFGHSFAGLADEYYAAAVPYANMGAIAEPWEPNASAMVGGRPKWSPLVEPGMPLPSPWMKAEYEATSGGAETAADRAARTERQAKLLAAEPLRGKVGAFEGAMYRSTGMFRPEVQCLMFNQASEGFCRVCRDAIGARIRELSTAAERR